MKIRMLVNYDSMLDTFNVLADLPMSEPWAEEFSTDCHCLADAPKGLTAMQYAQLVVDYFNDTLKRGELPRKLVKAEEIL